MTGIIEFMLFNVKTRRLLQSHRTASTIQLVEQQAANLGEGGDRGNLGYVLGHWDHNTHYVNANGEARYIGDHRPAPPLAQDDPGPVTAAMVDAQTRRRIEARYTLIDQINATNGVRDDVDFAWIAAVRVAGKTLKAMDLIPSDYADDHRWPPQTGDSNG